MGSHNQLQTEKLSLLINLSYSQLINIINVNILSIYFSMRKPGFHMTPTSRRLIVGSH